MFSSFVDIVNDIALGPQHRKVKKYLNEATCDSVSADLGRILSVKLAGWKERQLLQATFDRHYSEDPSSQQKYWNEESFRSYVRSAHPGLAIPDAALQLLWRSFHFFAYHPFPRDPRDGKVDFEAFQRAALLNVFRCNDFLGTRELDWFWRNDAAFYHKASVDRIFRSLGVPQTTAQGEPLRQQNGIASAMSDAMDVLVMIGPQFMHATPPAELLEGVARKLLAGEPAVAQREIRRNDVSTLIDLLLRIKLKKEKWGSFYHFGEFADANPADEALTEALVHSLIGDKSESEQTVTSEQLIGAQDLLPNLQLRFYQLWAILFQPPVEAGLRHEPETETAIAGAISLFAPHINTDFRYYQKTDQEDIRIAAETGKISPDPQDTTIHRLVQGLSNDASGYVLLFTGDGFGPHQKAAIGAYLPGSLHTASIEAGGTRSEARGNASHLLFQLQPRFRLLQWTKPAPPLTDLIQSEGKKIALGEISTSEGSEPSVVPYWVGDPSGQGTSLRIDPGKKTATLAGGDQRCYREVKVGGNGGHEKSWEVVIQNTQMYIFMVASPADHKD
ncbi:hypothetical protein GQ53DRAFT_206193 [Thozetella sp. PMI_491]|nr:hypothetical protein GQ53DRAFT_206193 [Thozetella sp. PMI_491]